MDDDLRQRTPATPNLSASVVRTFLIADVRGYTRFSDARGDEAAARLAERFLSIAREEVEGHSGAIVEVRGDEILAVFDSPREAVHAAADLLSALAAEQTEELPLSVGIGIDAGEAMPIGDGYRGRALNMAARLCARARPGEIIVTPELAHLSGNVEGIRFEDRGAVRLKGISRPVNLMTVVRQPALGEAAPARETVAGRLEFRLLGPLEVTEDGRQVPLAGPRQRLVMAHLLLSANRVLPMEELVDRVWDSDPPQAARNTIQSYVSHLRTAIGADRIELRTPGYVFHAEPEELDVLRFEQLLRRARRQLSLEPREAEATFAEGLELWRGSPLSDLADAPSLAGEIARLEELHLAALEDLLGTRLAIGEHAEALPDLERLTVEHPLRERLWAHLMLARYRSGRQAEALEAYRTAQELLARELGIDPSPELQDLQRRLLQQDPSLQLTGRPLRGYRLLEQVGEGAFGIVWRALDPELGREVAVKQIHPRLASDPGFVRRFEQEAQTIARLEHPHVVPLYDYWRDGSGAYLVMRWMRGGSLEDMLVRGPLDPEGAVRVVDQVASALSLAHRLHAIHRDVKPANVLLDEEGNAYLSDFGIAEDLTDWREVIPPGSLGYSSPEQLRGDEATPRSDIYGLGMVVQELLNGHGLAPHVADVVTRATADDPEGRYAEAGDLAVALRSALGLSVRRPSMGSDADARNPYKGLQAFTEADVDDFFGRDVLVDRLIARLAEPVEGSTFLTVVGPSGSGKSSAVRAGLVPALRRGALPGSDSWFYAEMLPGAHPIEELEAALLRIAVDPPRSLLELLERDEEGLARIVGRLLPDQETELVLVVDQFEEVFTMVEQEDARDHFLRSLVAAVREPRARLRIVTTLRADFYDRPLSYPGLAELTRRRSETVVPLTPEELERAIGGPADRVGVVPERALVAEMVADVSDRPGGLPLLQYALTELFDRRRDGALTLEAYRAIDGISGALARRAEELFEASSEPEREAAKQLFLRLVTSGDGQADTRRLVPRAEHVAARGSGRHAARDRPVRAPSVALVRSRSRHKGADRRGGPRGLARFVGAPTDLDRRSTRRSPPASTPGNSGKRLGDRGARRESALARVATRTAPHVEGIHRSGPVTGRAGLSISQHPAARPRARRRGGQSGTRANTRTPFLPTAPRAGSRAHRGRAHRGGANDDRGEPGGGGGAPSRRGDRRRADGCGALTTTDGPRAQLVARDARCGPELLPRAPGSCRDRRGPPLGAPGSWGRVSRPGRTRGSRHRSTGHEGRVFDLPLSQLMEAARSHVVRSLSASECRQFFGASTCPSLPPRTLPSDLVAEPLISAGQTTPGQPLAGTEVTLLARQVKSDSLARLRRDLDEFTSSTGIEVTLVDFPEMGNWISESEAEGDPPDLALTLPSVVVDLARNGHLTDMSTFLDVERLRTDQSPYLVSLGTVGPNGSWPSDHGRLYGAFAKISLKSLIWYPVPELRAAGYVVPRTWAELIALTDRLRATGRTPWCLGFESGTADGWPGTDWIENLLLAGAGTDAYDRWTFHELPFDSPPVRKAFERFDEILFTQGSVHGGTESGLETSVLKAQLPMVAKDPPDCWLYLQASFVSQFLPEGSVGKKTDVFPFPSIAGRVPQLIGGGEMIAAFADRPEVRELLRFILGPEFGAQQVGTGADFMSANRRFDLENYPPFLRRQARVLEAALAADTFRFDASDLMPPRIGNKLFLDAMMTYLKEGPHSLDRILAGLDAAWPDDE